VRSIACLHSIHFATSADAFSMLSPAFTAIDHTTAMVRVFIGQIRKKLEAVSGKQYIETEPWIGYRLVPEGIPR